MPNFKSLFAGCQILQTLLQIAPEINEIAGNKLKCVRVGQRSYYQMAVKNNNYSVAL